MLKLLIYTPLVAPIVYQVDTIEDGLVKAHRHAKTDDDIFVITDADNVVQDLGNVLLGIGK